MNDGPRSGPILAIDKPNFAAMSASDLLCKRKADTAAFRLGGVERHKKIFCVGDAEAAVFDADYEIRLSDAPSNAHRLGAVRQRRVDSVGEQVDKHLFELIGISIQLDRRTGIKADGHTLLEQSTPFEQGSGRNRLEVGRRQLREQPIGLHEAMQ